MMQSSNKVFPQTLLIAINNGAAQAAIGTANTFLSKLTNFLLKNSAGDSTTWTDIG